MALIKCIECGKGKSDTTNVCPHCGHRIKGKKLWLWIPLGAIAVVLGFGSYVANTPEGQARSRARAAIDLCHKEAQRNQNNPTAVGACQTMDSDFKNRFGVNP